MPESSDRRRTWRGRLGIALALAVGAAVPGAGCDLVNGLTNPSTPSTSTSTETFAGTLAVQGSSRFTFSVAQSGTVSLTLSTLSATVPVGLGVGTPNGTTGCTLTSSSPSTMAGSSPQITVTEPPGSYCVSVYDVGNLTGAATFSVIIVHP